MTDDPSKIVAAAFKILREKSVAKNIVTLIELYRKDNNSISINLKCDVDETLIAKFNMQEIKIAHQFEYINNTLQIIVANMRASMAPDSTGQYGDVFVIYNQECVLHNSISSEYTEWGSEYHIAFYDFSIELLKAGDWLDDLKLIVDAISAFEKDRVRQEKENSIRKTASKIDLSGFKID